MASAVSQFGTQVGYVAMPLLAVTALGAGPGEVGLLSGLATITVLVLGLPAGAWVDRVRRRPVMIATDLVRGALLMSVPVAWWLGALTMTQLYGVAIATGVGTLFFDVAAQSTVPHLVGRDRLTAANSVLVGTNAAMDVGGRSTSGVLVTLAGAPVAILLDALTYVSAACWRACSVRSGVRGRRCGQARRSWRWLDTDLAQPTAPRDLTRDSAMSPPYGGKHRL
ncbi:MFS transporter [Nonomuraea sp. NPDC049158]|uniref:MFS transporter n=1 Tax=Nonomuraea sp. NPDC049158 TaxID=3155649 RepID=UPI0033F6EA15